MKQLITFFALAYLISWLIWLPLYGHIFGLQGLPVLPYHHAIGTFGPMLAAFITTGIYKGKASLRLLAKKCVKPRPLVYLLLALLSPFAIAVIAIGISYIINGTPMNLSGPAAQYGVPHVQPACIHPVQSLFLWLWRGSRLAWVCIAAATA